MRQLYNKIKTRVDWYASHCFGRYMTVIPLTYFYGLDLVSNGALYSYLVDNSWELVPTIFTLLIYITFTGVKAKMTYDAHPDSLDPKLEYAHISRTTVLVQSALRQDKKAATNYLAHLNLPLDKIDILLNQDIKDGILGAPKPKAQIPAADILQLEEIKIEQPIEKKEEPNVIDVYYILYDLFKLIHPPHRSRPTILIQAGMHGFSHFTEVQLLKYFAGKNLFTYKDPGKTFAAGTLITMGVLSTYQTYHFDLLPEEPKYEQLVSVIANDFTMYQHNAGKREALLGGESQKAELSPLLLEPIKRIAKFNAAPGCAMD